MRKWHKRSETQGRDRTFDRGPRDWGQILARVLCILFAVIGTVPLAGGFVLQSPPLQRWAARETARLLEQHLGVEATYSVELSLWPLRLAVNDLVVPSKDGGPPALEARTAAVRPRFFSLLAGRVDVGDIELEESRARLVVRDGEIVNVDYRIPEASGESPELERAPFKTLAVTDARLDLDVDGTRLQTGTIDVDVLAERGLEFDVALRMGEGSITRKRATESLTADGTRSPPGEAWDEDRLCALDFRVRASRQELLVRRLSFLGMADLDAALGTAADCAGAEKNDPRRVALRLSQVRVTPREGGLPSIGGHVLFRGPTGVVNRFVDTLPLRGWVGYSGNLQFDGTTHLPEVQGKLSGADVGFGLYQVAEHLDGQVRISGDVITVPRMVAGYANGSATIDGLRVALWEEQAPIAIARVKNDGSDFPGLMRDLGITPNTIVDWNFGDTLVSDVRGTLNPFYLDGKVTADTSDFAVYDRAYHDPAKKRMVGVKRARVDGRFRAHAKALEFYDTTTAFGNSKLFAKLVSIGFEDRIAIQIPEGGVIDLADVGPLAGLEISGVSKVAVEMKGRMTDPVLTGELSVDDLSLAGFAVGDIKRTEARFTLLKVDFTNTVGVKNETEFLLPTARLDFDGPASVAFDAHVKSKKFGIRDFFEIWNLDEDPRWADISGFGTTEARVHYALGGPEDQCRGGDLKVEGRAEMSRLDLFGERYDAAESDFSFHWLDMGAGSQGFDLDVPSMTLRKGNGALIGSVEITPGGKISGDFVGTRVPIARLDALGPLGMAADGHVTGVGRVSGTLDALEVTSNVTITPVRVGTVTLPGSNLTVRLEPKKREQPSTGRTACDRPIAAPFDAALYASDQSQGTFHIDGSMFGGQVKLSDLKVSRSRSKVVAGDVVLDRFDLGALLQLRPSLAEEHEHARGRLSGRVALEEYFMDRPFASRVTMSLASASLGEAGYSIDLASDEATVTLRDGKLTTKGLAWDVQTPAGQRGIVDVGATIDHGTHLDASLQLRETDLGVLTAFVPQAERAEGRVRGNIDIKGPLGALTYTGLLEVKDGQVFVKGLDAPISNLQLVVGLERSGFSIRQGSARLGDGTLQLSGTAPLIGSKLGRMTAELRARGVTLPFGDGIRTTFNSDLQMSYTPGPEDKPSLPRVTGTVDVLSADYTRAMAVTADLATLTARGRKTEVDAYDPSRDRIEFDVLVRSPNPMSVDNALVDVELQVDPSGLRVSGTNQRFGAVGTVRIVPGGRVHLRRNEFEVKQGIVRFSDPTKIAPQVDVTATTEYRRYDDPGTTETATQAVSVTGSGGAVGSGNWRINLHAYGEPDNLKVDLTSEPALAQDDIFLLLTVGLTRAELDQTRSAGVGSSVALEALGTLSGADRAVTEAVPVIDEFRFGSAYSPRSGRTEPTVTIGKRLSERIRASVTTSLSDSSEVRSNVEWRVSKRVSVEASYDNVNDLTSPVVGNVGGDVRWRLEFE